MASGVHIACSAQGNYPSRSGPATSVARWAPLHTPDGRVRYVFTYPSGLNTRGNIRYDSMGRVWQRWNDNSVTGDWDADLKRFVYDGPALAQEHKFAASGNGSWTYTYGRCDIDYLRKPDGIRQKVNNGVGGWDSHLLFNDGADVASRTPSGSSTTITRTLRTASGDRLNDNPRMTPGLTTGSFSNISNLAKPNSYIESYGGGTELGTSSLGFDSLVQSGPVHKLPALGGMLLGSPVGSPGGGGSSGGGGASGGNGWTPGSGWSQLSNGGQGPVPGSDDSSDCWCGSKPSGEFRECCCLLLWQCGQTDVSTPYVPCVYKDTAGNCWVHIGKLCWSLDTPDHLCNIIPVCMYCECCNDEATRNAYISQKYAQWHYFDCVKADECYPDAFYLHETRYEVLAWGFDCDQVTVASTAPPASGLWAVIIGWFIGRGALAAARRIASGCSNIVRDAERYGLPGQQIMFKAYDYCRCSGVSVGFGQ